MTSLAVLPFRAVGTEPAAHFGLGIADAVISRLATYRQITVRPTSAVRRYETVDADAIQAGHHLGVDAVVEGTVRQVEGGTRAVVQLTDVGRGAVVWSEQLDLPKGRLFELQDTLATRLVDHLQVKLDTFARPAPGRPTGISDSALQRYLSARSQLSEASEEPGRATALLAELNGVLQDEPGFAPALAARAYARAWRNYYSPELRGPEAVLRDAADALEVDPALELPHVARATLAWSSQGGWRFVDAVRELRMAMSASPGSEIPHLELARMFYHWGWLSEARRELGEIRRIDPLSLHAVRAAAFVAWFDGHHREALARFSESAGEGDRRSVDRRWQEAAIRLQTDPRGVPLGELEAWVAEEPQPIPMATLAVARARQGDRGISELEQRILSTNQEVGHFHHVLHLLAEARAQLGDTFGAIGYLRRASETGLPCLPCFDNDPLLTGVRGAPEYAALRVELRSRSEAARAALGAH
jgi:TolB-like protein